MLTLIRLALTWGLVWGVPALALVVYAGFLAARYFYVARFPDEIHFATTSDGQRVAVYRYRPAAPAPALGEAAPTRDPVLLLPGIAANRLNFDLSDDNSLALHLAAQGHDTYILEFRGRGQSSRPRLFSGLRYDWSFDEYAERDLPAGAAVVLAISGRPRLHLVGFSTGALSAYAYLSDPHRTVEVASLVSLGGPTSWKRTSTFLSSRVIKSLRYFRHRFLLRVLAPISGYWHPVPFQLIHNPENMNGPTQRRAMANMIANFSRNELLQYSDWLEHNVFRSIDQRRDYRAELPRITTPAMFVAGPRDLLAPPDAVKDTHDAVSSTDKRFVILSRAQRFRVNYGHFDMLLGPHAAAEVFPVIAEWLAAHAEPRAELGEPAAADVLAPLIADADASLLADAALAGTEGEALLAAVPVGVR